MQEDVKAPEASRPGVLLSSSAAFSTNVTGSPTRFLGLLIRCKEVKYLNILVSAFQKTEPPLWVLNRHYTLHKKGYLGHCLWAAGALSSTC